MNSELPLRIIDDPNGPIIQCLCEAEAATIRTDRDRVARDVSPAAVARMAMHARTCLRGRNRQLELETAANRMQRVP